MHANTVATFAGFGLGLRPPHYQEFLTTSVAVDFVEVISENFMIDGGRPLHVLEQIRAKHPVALHGVSMSLGSADGLDREHLGRLQQLVERIEPLFVSDHLSWTRIDGFNSHDLLPIPYTEEALDLVCSNVAQAQDAIGRALLVENPSTYLQFAQSAMTEWEFLTELCKRTGCNLLLDINNIYVSATNHGFDPHAYLAGVPVERVRQLHLAGHSQGSELLIDTHNQPVPDPVWALYAAMLPRLGAVATMIERDDAIPPLSELLLELDTARAIAGNAARKAA
ncbi:MAG: DUF692 domain-containing protein [Lysobacteraceae bacterium]